MTSAKTIRSFCGPDSGRGCWAPLPNQANELLDQLFAEAEQKGLPTVEGAARLVGSVGFWLNENGEPRAVWGWGLDPNARRLDGCWYILLSPDDGRGLTPEVELQCAISDLVEGAAIRRDP
jgi:hypothetical protein